MPCRLSHAGGAADWRRQTPVPDRQDRRDTDAMSCELTDLAERRRRMRPRITYAADARSSSSTTATCSPPTATTNAPSNPWRNGYTQDVGYGTLCHHRGRPSRAAKGLNMKRLSIVSPRQRTNRPLRDRTQAQDGGLGNVVLFHHGRRTVRRTRREAYEQRGNRPFDAMNHFDELGHRERANPTERTPITMDWRHCAACRRPRPEPGSAANHTNRRPRAAICRLRPVIGERRWFADEHNRSTATSCGTWGGC